MAGLQPHQWANCAMLQPLLTALLPDDDLDAHGVVLLDVATTQLLKLGDADQQCEALLNGPQCERMRTRLTEAELLLALVNDNEDAAEAGGGGHWSVVACRRSHWRDGVFVVEHYDSSGDIEMNADAAGLVGTSLAERSSELTDREADRIEVWRMKAPLQHDASVCGLTAVSYIYQLYVDHIKRRQQPPKARGAPVTPDGVLSLTWEHVEALRRQCAAVWGGAGVVEAAAEYEAELKIKSRPSKICSQHCEVVFDMYEDEDEEEDYASEEEEAGEAPKAAAGVSGPFGAFLQAIGISGGTQRLLCRSTSLAACADLSVKDRPGFLRHLKQLGVSKLTERQTLANSFAKAVRSRWLVPPYDGYSGPAEGAQHVPGLLTSTPSAPSAPSVPLAFSAPFAPKFLKKCEKCDGNHATSACPHFNRAREFHPDAAWGAQAVSRPMGQTGRYPMLNLPHAGQRVFG